MCSRPLPHTARPAIRFTYFAMARMLSCSRSRSCTPRCRPARYACTCRGPTGPCCTRPLPWPIWLTYWKTTASCAHTKAFWSIWSTSAICKARDCICATEPSCRSVRTQPVPCGKSIRSGGARKNGLLVRDRFQLLGRAVRGRFLRCVS